MPDVLNKLGQTTVPAIFDKLYNAGLLRLMNITTGALTSDGAGGQRKAADSNAYSNIRVSVKTTGRRVERKTTSGSMKSFVLYKLTFPTHQSGSRVNFNIDAHGITVLASGNEPARVFRPVGAVNEVGAHYEVEAWTED